MKATNNILKMILTVALFVAFSSLYAQEYTVDFSDTSTYDVTCGKVVPAQWSVKNDSCLMYTPYFRVEAEGGSEVSFSFRINQSGNGDGSDNGYVFHQVDDGEWILDSAWTAGGSPAVYTLEDQITLNYGHYVRFMVALQTNSKTEFWAIKGGDVVIDDNDPLNEDITIWGGKPPLPPPTDPFLPIELITFNGKVNDGSVILKWSTASEANNDFFTIEKSDDGINFESVGFVDGSGNSNTLISYEYVDENPYKVTFYRLKQTDYDGAYAYSSTIKVSEEICNSNQIEIFGNNGEVNVMTNLSSSGKLNVNIYTISGTQVMNSTTHVEPGCSTLKLSPERMGDAIYMVSASFNSQKPVTAKVYLNY